jgi:hypothetical protein
MTEEARIQDSASVALAWVAAANAHDADRLDAVSNVDIEIVGPRETSDSLIAEAVGTQLRVCPLVLPARTAVC